MHEETEIATKFHKGCTAKDKRAGIFWVAEQLLEYLLKNTLLQ
jgi:hypothetical protein